jgi:flagellar basal body-associated protein FliL
MQNESEKHACVFGYNVVVVVVIIIIIIIISSIVFVVGGCVIFFFSFGVLQLVLPEAPQRYRLLYYPRIGLYNILHQFRAATPANQR